MPATAVVDFQWGDGGKGKIIDLIAEPFYLGVRGNGGGNAGHSVYAEGKEAVLHLVPSCVVRGKRAAIGRGCVIYPDSLANELKSLANIGINNIDLMIDGRTHVTTDEHIREDGGNTKIGTTGKGIGPTYTSKYARKGIRMVDYAKNNPESRLMRLKPMIGDVALEVNRCLDEGKNVLLEGAQGFGLCVDNGTYPFVTSSNTTVTGLCAGVGVSERRVDRVIGVVKAYPTRVGNGPMPTQFGGEKTEEYCKDATHGKLFELKTYGIPHEVVRESGEVKIKYNHRDEKILEMMNSDDGFTKGIGLRLAGDEYGATTGRARKPGWLDGVEVRSATLVNHPNEIALTKLDVLDGLKELKICIDYEAENGRTLHYLPADTNIMWGCKPIYEKMDGWNESITGVRSFENLPKNAQRYVNKVETISKAPVTMIGVGPERSQIILRELGT